jgi:hypothetical protein
MLLLSSKGSLFAFVFQGHAFSLLLKDYAKHVAVFRDVIKTANTVTTFFNKPRARPALRQHQLDKYTKVKQLSMPSDTRFAYQVDMLDCLADSAKALQLCSTCIFLSFSSYPSGCA